MMDILKALFKTRPRVPLEEMFRVTTNGLWHRIEYASNDGWCSVSSIDCYSNIHNRFPSAEQANKVCDFLKKGGSPHEFTTGVE